MNVAIYFGAWYITSQADEDTAMHHLPSSTLNFCPTFIFIGKRTEVLLNVILDLPFILLPGFELHPESPIMAMSTRNNDIEKVFILPPYFPK